MGNQNAEKYYELHWCEIRGTEIYYDKARENVRRTLLVCGFKERAVKVIPSYS